MSDAPTEDAAAPLKGLAALEQAFGFYRDAGLRIPPVPHELVDSLTEEAPGIYTTMPMNLEDPDAVATLDAAAPQQLGFGYLGHGVSSWFYCCRLVTPALAVYLRLSYGSAYVEDGSDIHSVNSALVLIEELVVAAKDAAETGRLPPGSRMLVVMDVLGTSRWQLDGEPPTDSADPISDALEWLTAA